ncbi:MAG: hypothetical protein COW02_09885 [Comamonadaceae bacterium CG12_big_fil_rev_8_21_14_0_65_59_15]|nr:MAG: hypothetical protein COW02_09885 [Comamonadaceae bacterium CG12_big_fil_rev_8_21_14_0_65_59_15]
MKNRLKSGVLRVVGAARVATGSGGHLILGYQKSVSAAAGYHAMYLAGQCAGVSDSLWAVQDD